MPHVTLARHLYAFFPKLEGKEINVDAETAADVVKEMEKLAPGFAFYICDERGSLRTHVNLFIEENMVSDRKKLSDRVKPDSKVYILQALSGG